MAFWDWSSCVGWIDLGCLVWLAAEESVIEGDFKGDGEGREG